MNKSSAGSRRALRGGVLAAAIAVGGMAIAGVAPAVTEQGSPPVNAGVPTISGEVRQGDTLTVKPGNWSGATPITITHQWQQCDSGGTGCTAISGATGTTYVLVAGDVGKTIRVLESAQNADGSAQAFSAPTAVVAPPNSAPANTAQPNPSGTAQDGQTITVDTGTWTGTAPITYTYQWQRCTPGTGTCTSINGATTSSYLLVTADVGFQMRSQVTATNTVGSSSVFSNLTQTVIAKGTAPANTGVPLIVGDATVGKSLTGFVGQWSGASGFAYQWMRCNSNGSSCAAIANATTVAYTLVSADGNQTVRFKVTATNTSGSTDALSSAVHVTPLTSGNSIAVGDLVARPDHLLIKELKYSQNPFGSPGGTFTIKVKVILEGTNKVVIGALVYVVPSPSTWAKASAELPTGNDGWASLKIQTTKSLPHSGTLNMQVRARGPGNSDEAILGGISTRRLVSLKLK